MNWNGFLAPDLRKVVIALVLAFLFAPLFIIRVVSPCQVPPCPERHVYISPARYLLSDNMRHILSSGYAFDKGIGWGWLLVGIAASYLIACGAVHWYERRKK